MSVADARLSLARLTSLPPGIQHPGYDPATLKPGILHLGIGAFHRAHQAFYTDAALAKSGGDWGIIGASLRGAGMRDRLLPQDCLYTLAEKGAAETRRRVISAVRDVIYASDDRARLPSLIADPRIRIVSLTVTEKGYCHDPATGKLNVAHPDIVHDFAHPEAPVSTIGILAAGLKLRRGHGAPLTLMSCDNLPHNGATLRGLVLEYAARADAETALWIGREAAFPSSMVDRIVPPTTSDLIEETAAALGMNDEAPVACEPFTQWVIEDEFAAGRPGWHEVGVEIVSEVAPYEEMKLRMVNGSHSMLAYLGYLGGFEFISEVMRDADYVGLARDMMEQEIAPTLPIAGTYDLAAYREKILERFSNPSLAYRCDQVAMDGSQKLPQRLLGTIRANLGAGRPFARLALAVAAWMRFVMGTDERGRAVPIRDPLADILTQRVKAGAAEPKAIADRLIGIEAIFGRDLPGNATFREAVSTALALLVSDGARATVHHYSRTAG